MTVDREPVGYVTRNSDGVLEIEFPPGISLRSGQSVSISVSMHRARIQVRHPETLALVAEVNGMAAAMAVNRLMSIDVPARLRVDCINDQVAGSVTMA